MDFFVKRTLNRVSVLFLLISAIPILFVSCNRQGNHKKLEALRNQCEEYAVQSQTDTLRSAASRYLLHAKKGSKDYYYALYFQVLSDFNVKDYSRVVNRTSKITAQPALAQYKDVACHFQFTKARAFQKSGQFEDAIGTFKYCFKYDSPDDSVRNTIRTIAVEAMLQMTNSYHSEGKFQDCAVCLDSLRQHQSALIKQLCERDLYSLSAYSLYMTDDIKKAIALMDSTLAMPLYAPTSQRLFRDYSYAAAIYNGWPGREKQTIELCNKALSIGFKDKSISGLNWLIDLLGELYHRQGEIEKAIDLYQMSANYSKEKKDLNGEADAYMNLSTIYFDLGLYNQADDFADHALVKNLEQQVRNPKFCGDAYLKKAGTIYQLGKVDSAFYYIHLADSCFQGMPYSVGRMQVDELIGGIQTDMPSKTDVQDGIDHLKKVLKVHSNNTLRAEVFLLLAKGLIKQGNDREGEAMLDSMYAIVNASPVPFYIEGANRFALQYYLKKNDVAKVSRVAASYLKENEERNDKQVQNKTMQFILKYKAEQQEQQLRLMQSELKNRKLSLILSLSLAAILLIILSGSIYIFVHKKRNFLLRHQLMEERLSDLSQKLSETSQHSNEVESKLSGILNDMSKRQQLASITPDVFRGSGEARFRSLFAQLYPSYLDNLHIKVPNISRNEEIICMLIVLGQTPEQILETLCIERGSLNMARHRLRQKIQLQYEESLDDFVKSLL
jgi:tetratricopeptide (TPR) repeat protein